MFRDAVIAILSTIAKLEHARLSERVVAGLRRAKGEGKILGRKRIILDREKVRAMHTAGQPVRAIAATMGVSKSLIGNILAEQNGSSTPNQQRKQLGVKMDPDALASAQPITPIS